MKKRKARILAFYAGAFFLVITLFSVSIFAFVSTTQLDKVDTDLVLYKNAIVRLSGRNIVVNMPVNPKTVTIIRGPEGALDPSYPLPNYYKEGLDHFHQVVRDELTTIEYKGSHYRTLRFDVLQGGETIGIQLLYNIDSDIQVLSNLRKILLNGSIMILLAALLISYFLTNVTVQPMKESLEKQRAFLQDASHELRTPIAVIQSRLEGLLRNPEEKIIDKYEYIEPALRETRRMAKMVSNLLVLTRADAGEAMGKFERFDLRKLGDDVAIIYSEFTTIQNKKFQYNPREEVLVEGNYEKLHQLLIILLDNALKYTKENGVIELRISNLKDKGRIQVLDDGIGIKEENLENVFMRFFREDKARNRSNGGTGLGLSIAKWITDSHCGTIHARRNPQGGTIIEVLLPKDQSKAGTAKNTEA